VPSFSYTFSTAANSTQPGTSPAANLDWRGGKPTSIALSFGGSSAEANDVYIQYTLDDIQLVGGSSLATWMTLSSAINNNSTTAYHLASTTWFDTGFLAQVISPLAAVRMVSSALTASATAVNTITLKVLQGTGGR
jgi:hypothetical protein